MKLRVTRTRAAVIAGLATTLVLRAPIAGQLEAWRTQFDVGTSDPRTFFDFFGLPTYPPQQSAMASDGAHYSVVSVIDGGFRSVLVRHDPTGALSWNRPLDGNGLGSAVAVDDDDNPYVTADSYRCAAVRKFDAMGNPLWTAVAQGVPACDYYWSYLVIDGDAVYAGGVFRDTEALIFARFDLEGEPQWTFVREVEPGTQTLVTGLAVDSLGALLASGSFWNPTTDYLVLKIDAGGDLEWERSFDFGSSDFPMAIVVGPDDRVTVSGISYGQAGIDYQTVQYDNAGTELWNRRIERDAQYGQFWWNSASPALAVDSTGRVYLTGAMELEDVVELLLVKYDLDGDELFRQRLPQYAEGRNIVIDGQDRPFVSAPALSGDRRFGTVVGFATDGSVRWHMNTEEAFWVMPSGLSLRAGKLVMAATVAPDEIGVSEGTLWVGLDEDGEVQWQAGEPVRGLSDSYCGASDDFNRVGSCLALGPDGSVYLGGSSVESLVDFSLDQRAVKLAADGSLEWTRRFVPPGDEVSGQGAVALGVTPSGAVHLAGHGSIAVGYDTDGNETWTQPVIWDSQVRATAADSTGAAYVLARFQGDMLDVSLQKYRPDGTSVWSVGFAGPGSGNDDARAMTVTGDDRIVYVGQASAPGRLDGLVRAHDTNGNVVFSRTIESVGDSVLSALIAAGDFVIAAGAAKSATDLDALVLRLDSAGSVTWRRDLDGDAPSGQHGDDEANAVAVDPAGNAYVAGRTWAGDDFDLFIVKLDASGNELWRRVIDFGHGDDEAWSAAFDAPGAGGAAGSLWIAGRASNGKDTDALTLRLDADGTERFRALVAGTEQRDDEHYDLVVGPPGHATVAGASAEIDESYNFQAIRYVTSPLDVDYDGEASALNDGLLIMRWLFGFRGSVLTTDAVDPALCIRCLAGTIDVHLSAIGGMIDVDGNGAADPLTDGVLTFRWLFGFHGTALVTGAVDLAHCTRCEAPAIEAYLQSLAG